MDLNSGKEKNCLLWKAQNADSDSTQKCYCHGITWVKGAYQQICRVNNMHVYLYYIVRMV